MLVIQPFVMIPLHGSISMPWQLSIPRTYPLQILHALKIGLCIKISQGSISTGAAITLFNDMVDTVANKRDEAEKKGENKL
jgi:hypothetical protein